MPFPLPIDVLIDTGVLLDLVLADVAPGVARAVLRTEEQVTRVREYLAPCRRRATTAHVLKELDAHLMREWKNDHLRTARRDGFSALALYLSEARGAWLDAMDLEKVAAFGVADAGLLEVAAREKLTLLTADSTLYEFARRSGIDALSIWEVTAHPLYGR